MASLLSLSHVPSIFNPRSTAHQKQHRAQTKRRYAAALGAPLLPAVLPAPAATRASTTSLSPHQSSQLQYIIITNTAAPSTAQHSGRVAQRSPHYSQLDHAAPPRALSRTFRPQKPQVMPMEAIEKKLVLRLLASMPCCDDRAKFVDIVTKPVQARARLDDRPKFFFYGTKVCTSLSQRDYFSILLF